MSISKEVIQKLRQQTGAGIMDIKKALEQANGDEIKALEILRKMGQKLAEKKQATRETKDGVIGNYIHSNLKVASLVVLSCETDFVAKNQEFKNLAHDLAMQVAGLNPEYISENEIPAKVIEKEKEIYKAQPELVGKPENIQEKIIQGKLNKFYSENCLLNQKFIKDDKKNISDLINDATAKLGEKIEIKKIIRFSL